MINQLRESSPNRLKKIIQEEWRETSPEVIGVGASFLMGLGLGALGKNTGREEIYCILPAMDFIAAGFPRHAGHLAYILGVATNYFPEIAEMYFR